MIHQSDPSSSSSSHTATDASNHVHCMQHNPMSSAAARSMLPEVGFEAAGQRGTRRFGSTAKVLAKRMLGYNRISECVAQSLVAQEFGELRLS